MNTTYNRTKIVATLGPASSSKEVLTEMIRAGVDVCRINSSHGDHKENQKVINIIREINKEHLTHTAILVDLQGPKMRIGTMEGKGAELVAGNEIIITTEECVGTAKKIFLTYPDFPKDVKIGDAVLIDDGKIKLEVTETDKQKTVKAKIIFGGLLSSKKGFNLPNTFISLPCLTPKDIEDLHFALDNDVDWIGLSFVRKASDIIELKDIIAKRNKTCRVIAKIEKPEAVRDIDGILEVTDGLMVARGDLGVEMPMEEVPVIQKMLVRKSLNASKPIIIATQMMESMITNFNPTRAEVNDVANSVMDGADAVMLSGETSVGKYPIQVIECMQRIIATVEKEEVVYNKEHMPSPASETFISDSVCYNACVMSLQVGAKAIIGMTHSGYTAFKLSSQRPKADIFIFSDNRTLLTTLSLVWGVRTFFYDRYVSTNNTIAEIQGILKTAGFVESKDVVINLHSIPMGEMGRANMIKLSHIK